MFSNRVAQLIIKLERRQQIQQYIAHKMGIESISFNFIYTNC